MIGCIQNVTDFISKHPDPDSINQRRNTSFIKQVFKMHMPRAKQTVNKNNNSFLKKSSIQDFLEDKHNSIIAYPQSDINEIMSIMTSLELQSIPVVKNPWDMTLVGFITLETLKQYCQF